MWGYIIIFGPVLVITSLLSDAICHQITNEDLSKYDDCNDGGLFL